jgi:hypothetical protein
MAGAIGFQGWLSIAKPWGRTPWAPQGSRGRTARLPTAPDWVFAAAVLAPVVDLVAAALLGRPTPVCCLLVLALRLSTRRRELRTAPVPEMSGVSP